MPIDEDLKRRLRFDFPRMSEPYRLLVEAEPLLRVFANRHVFAVEMEDEDTIAAVKAIDTLTGAISVYRAEQFIDCTGDGWVGYYAGAKYRIGRESREEFGEDLAPAEADRLTMSGCLMGNLAVGFRSADTGRPVHYKPPTWAAQLPVENFGRQPRGFTGGHWWLEHQGEIDDLDHPELARDELVRITFGYWDWIKNHWQDRALARDYALVYVPHGHAKRETRRPPVDRRRASVLRFQYQSRKPRSLTPFRISTHCPMSSEMRIDGMPVLAAAARNVSLETLRDSGMYRYFPPTRAAPPGRNTR